jgi:transcription elongation factor Elf1
MIEHAFTCPYCWEQISILVDPSVQEQTYIEDCEVCCRPIRIHVRTRRREVVSFDAAPSQ